jgi:hypothetical protein
VQRRAGASRESERQKGNFKCSLFLPIWSKMTSFSDGGVLSASTIMGSRHAYLKTKVLRTRCQNCSTRTVAQRKANHVLVNIVATSRLASSRQHVLCSCHNSNMYGHHAKTCVTHMPKAQKKPNSF